MRIAVFVSGSGSNMVMLAHAAKAGDLQADIAAVICDKPQAAAIQKAKNLGLDVWEIDWKKPNIEDLLLRLKAENIEMIILAGFMRMIPPYFLTAFGRSIINVHPSLLPKYPGLHGIEDSYHSGDKTIGITIHYIDEGMDTGPIIAQFTVIREADDSLEDIEDKIHGLEHANYWRTIQKVIEGKA